VKVMAKNKYTRSVLMLITGTGLAQAIPILLSPILTRLYTPADFGLFGLYVAVVSVLSIIATGRYEGAIMIPRGDREAINIVILTVIICLGMSLLILLACVVFGDKILYVTGHGDFRSTLYWLPIGVLATGTYQTLNYWNNRRGDFKIMATSRVLQSISGGAAQIILKFIDFLKNGLVMGQIIGQLIVVTYIVKKIYTRDLILLKAVTRNRLLMVAKNYSNFPKYLIVAHGLNIVSFQLPVILLGVLFDVASAGLYVLLQRTLSLPIRLVSGAIGDVFRQEAALQYSHIGNCRYIYIRTLKALIFLSLIPFILLFMIAPNVFAIVFGESWRQSGEYARIMIPMFFLRFITSPLSVMFVIAQKQGLDLLWQIMLFLSVSLALIVGYWKSDLKMTLGLICLTYSCMYLINVVISYKLSCGYK